MIEAVEWRMSWERKRRLPEQNHVLPLPGQVTSIFARPGFGFPPTSNNHLEPHAFRAPRR